MSDTLFLAVLTLILLAAIVWGARTLPRERWQIIAAAPTRRAGPSSWEGVNFTWYGFFSATAYVLAVGIYYLLLRALGVSGLWAATAMGLLLAVCIPASRLVARVVEKKPHTFTVGGASFVGILLAPWIILATNRLLARLPEENGSPAEVMAAFAIAFALGEGMGRLACLSFGCCYGKPLALCSPWLRWLFAGRATVFLGSTKKAAYAGNLAGKPLLPVQTLTSMVNSAAALAGIWLLSRGHAVAACLTVLTASQLWRFFSEFLRADYRGDGRISAYQWMGLAAVAYTAAALPVLSGAVPPHRMDFAAGLLALWNPAPILLFQALWAFIFFSMGKSMVTRASISFHVVQDRI